jgi:purine nucleosidase
MTSRKFILDCDPGIDDAIAITLCGASPELDLIGVTVTHGNVPLARTVENALSVVNVLNLDVPVFAGADRPLVRAPIYAPDVHGSSGLGGITLPPHSRTIEKQHAVDFIIEAVMSDPGNVSLFGVGPLTNIALAIRREPRFASSIREIVVMGGSIGEGNTSAAAEFNALADPHAMRIVFESGCPITMFGLDVTHKVLAIPERLRAIVETESEVARLTVRFMEAYLPSYRRRYGWTGAAIHDMCPVAWAVAPELFILKPMTIRVDTNEGPNFGRTVCDSQCRDDTLPIIQVAYDAHVDELFAFLAERIARYN